VRDECCCSTSRASLPPLPGYPPMRSQRRCVATWLITAPVTDVRHYSRTDPHEILRADYYALSAGPRTAADRGAERRRFGSEPTPLARDFHQPPADSVRVLAITRTTRLAAMHTSRTRSERLGSVG